MKLIFFIPVFLFYQSAFSMSPDVAFTKMMKSSQMVELSYSDGFERSVIDGLFKEGKCSSMKPKSVYKNMLRKGIKRPSGVRKTKFDKAMMSFFSLSSTRYSFCKVYLNSPPCYGPGYYYFSKDKDLILFYDKASCGKYE